MPTVCLAMIVKNEEEVIKRSLHSILPFVDSWYIVDTGSTDATMQMIQSVASELSKPGHLTERPWVNFGHNRTELLDLAREFTDADWLYMLDADDIFNALVPNPFASLYAEIDAYTIQYSLGTLQYVRPALFNTRMPWIYKGVIHEYCYLPKAITQHLTTVSVDARSEGCRSKNPDKYKEDALLLETEVAKDSSNPRNLFYLAQSWRDAGFPDKALEWYKKTLEVSVWDQERYIVLLNLIRSPLTLLDEKRKYAWNALQTCPRRLEASHSLLTAFRKENVWDIQVYALAFFNLECNTKQTEGQTLFIGNEDLFIEKDIYRYTFYDEFAIYSFYTNHREIAETFGKKALEECGDTKERIRLFLNLKYYIEPKLAESPSSKP